jgi:hypothetical protein
MQYISICLSVTVSLPRWFFYNYTAVIKAVSNQQYSHLAAAEDLRNQFQRLSLEIHETL